MTAVQALLFLLAVVLLGIAAWRARSLGLLGAAVALLAYALPTVATLIR